jgi:hypothetical protein
VEEEVVVVAVAEEETRGDHLGEHHKATQELNPNNQYNLL